MKTIYSLLLTSMLFSAPSLLARPQIKADVLKETQEVDQTITGIQKYQSNYWAIGLNGDTLEADGFLKFFQDRSLELKYFVRSNLGVQTGEETAYAENIKVLQDYRSKILSDEISELDSVISDMEASQDQTGSVGFVEKSMEPDAFVEYFSDHSLPLTIYFQNDFVSIGDSSAFETNLATLRAYREKLVSAQDSLDLKAPIKQPIKQPIKDINS